MWFRISLVDCYCAQILCASLQRVKRIHQLGCQVTGKPLFPAGLVATPGTPFPSGILLFMTLPVALRGSAELRETTEKTEKLFSLMIRNQQSYISNHINSCIFHKNIYIYMWTSNHDAYIIPYINKNKHTHIQAGLRGPRIKTCNYGLCMSLQ